MPTYRIERTESVTRVYHVQADSESDAWRSFELATHDDDCDTFYSGHPELSITQEPDDNWTDPHAESGYPVNHYGQDD